MLNIEHCKFVAEGLPQGTLTHTAQNQQEIPKELTKVDLRT